MPKAKVLALSVEGTMLVRQYTSSILGHDSKAPYPMLAMLVGRVIEVSPLQYSKA